MRYSLRTLAVSVALVAVTLGSWMGYRRSQMCRLEWVAPGSTAASPNTVISQRSDGNFVFIYLPRHRSERVVTSAIRSASDWMCSRDGASDTLRLRVPDRAGAVTILNQLQAADAPQPG